VAGYDPTWGGLFTTAALNQMGQISPVLGGIPGIPPLFRSATDLYNTQTPEMQRLVQLGTSWQNVTDPNVAAASAAATAALNPNATPSSVPGSAQPPVPVGGANDVAGYIIQQESGGAPPTPNNLNCAIRPQAGCLDLNTGIFESTAKSLGLDWNRLVAGDAQYGHEAVATLLNTYAQADAGNGMTVWQYGEQNLPGGGWEAVGRYYFGGCVTNGCFVDEQGRSVDTYGQQFVTKLANAGILGNPATVPGSVQPPIITGPQQLPGSAVTGLSPETGLPVNVDPAVSQWADPIHAASEFHGVPAARLAAEIAVNSGGQWVDPSMDTTAQVPDVYGGPSVGLMKITPQASGDYCTTEWCGWGDGTAETQAYGVNHNIFTPDGNIMMGAAILRSNYDLAKQMYPTATEDQLWDMASSLFETGTVNWDDGGDGSAAATKHAIDAIAGTNTTTLAPVTTTDATGVTQHPLTGDVITTATGPVPANVPTASATSDPTGQAIADLADNYVNVNYVWGGNPRQGQDPYRTGWDCSGFVSFIADSMGYSVRDRPDGIPEGSGAQGDWAVATGRMKPVNQAQPGDVIFFDTRDTGGSNGGATGRYTHVGIYLGDGMMINAMQECGPGLQPGVTCGTGVVNVNDAYWSSHAVGAASMIPTG
jgi:cell wall-associated NlpC family hydrolase